MSTLTFHQSRAFQPYSPSRGRGSSVFSARSLPERNSGQPSIRRPLPQRTEGPLSVFEKSVEKGVILPLPSAPIPHSAGASRTSYSIKLP